MLLDAVTGPAPISSRSRRNFARLKITLTKKGTFFGHETRNGTVIFFVLYILNANLVHAYLLHHMSAGGILKGQSCSQFLTKQAQDGV